MAIELVLDASVSLAWFLKETPERAAYAAAVSAAAADGAILHVPVQWGIEMGHVLLREQRRKVLKRGKLQQALEDLDCFDIRVHLELFTPRRVVDLARRYHLQGYDALYFDLARTLGLPLATLDHGHRQEMAVSRERLAKLEHALETLRNTARAEEWPALSSGYRLEIERMQGEILDYLVQNAPRREGAPGT